MSIGEPSIEHEPGNQPPGLRLVADISSPDPQATEGFLTPIDGPYGFTPVHGQVEVPGARKPVPYILDVPDHLSSPLIHVIGPGFGGFDSLYAGLGEALSMEERLAALRFGQARFSEDPADPQRVHADTYTAILQDLPDNEELKNLPNAPELDLEQLVLILHSMASIGGTRHASIHPPERTPLIIYLESVGLEDHGFARFIGRLGNCAAHEIAPGILKREFRQLQTAKTIVKMFEHHFSNLVQTGGEIVTCHQAELRPAVAELGEAGVKQAMLFGGKDRLVPPDPSVKGASHLVDICEVVPHFDHFAPQKRPEETAARIGAISRKLV